MSDSVNEDREQRKTTSMEESNAMTIEFLRARLLAERSVSKSARQRADELAKRVAELEEKLKFVSLQRKKAEKATVDVLAILENHGINDLSEEFDSCSDQEESPRDFKTCNGSLMIEVISSNTKSRKNEMNAYSSSEVESSPSTGRSLSWRSTKDSQHSLENKKYMDPVRRRASFASNGSSARKVGKSCRRIRHRETRSIEELQNNGTEKAACSVDASDGSNNELVALTESSGYEDGNNALASTTLGSNSGTQKMNGLHVNVHERDEMESALQHQAQLIGRYEEEEKAQREWEEKLRENNSGTQDSGDPGNHSDVTEERYEMKSPEPLSRAVETSNSDNQETKQELADACPQTSKSLPSLTDSADKRSSHDEKCSSTTNACESSASEFSFPTSNEKSDKDFSKKQHEASELRFQQYLPTALQTTTHGPTKTPSSSYEGKSVPLSASNRISSPLELAVVPQEPSNNLGSVLDALQRAKLSLNQKLNHSPVVSAETSSRIIQPFNAETNKVESFQIPFGTPGLFRLPTDYQFETGIDARPRFANFFPENTLGRFLDSRSAFSGDLFLTAPYSPFTLEIGPGVSPERSLSHPRLNEGSSVTSNRMNNLDRYTNPVLPSVKDSYPFLTDVTLRLPLNGEGTSRTFPCNSSERGLPSVMRLSSYDEHVRPNMYR